MLNGGIIMKVKELIEKLKTLDENKDIYVSSDEEWNAIFTQIEIQLDGEDGNPVIFGLSGSEL